MRRRSQAAMCVVLAVLSLVAWVATSRWAIDWWQSSGRDAYISDCREFNEVPSAGFWCTAELDGSTYRVAGADAADVGHTILIVPTTHWPARQGVPAVHPGLAAWTLLLALPLLALILLAIAAILPRRDRREADQNHAGPAPRKPPTTRG